MTESYEIQQDSAPTHAFRVVISAKGMEVADVKAQRVRMRVPASDRTYGLEGSEGCWCELRDEGGKVLYRKILADTLRSVEGPSGDPKRPLMRVDTKDRRNVVVLLVPDLEQAQSLFLCDSQRGESKDLWKFNIDDLRKGEG